MKFPPRKPFLAFSAAKQRWNPLMKILELKIDIFDVISGVSHEKFHFRLEIRLAALKSWNLGLALLNSAKIKNLDFWLNSYIFNAKNAEIYVLNRI